MTGTRLSIWPTLSRDWPAVTHIADHADAEGWDGVWVADHFMGDGASFGPATTPMLEATAALSALAASTNRVRLGSLVFGTTYRHPAVMANWAATTDQISGGRLVLGVGAGWQQNEHSQYGIDLPPVADRVSRFAEVCEVARRLLREERVDFHGDWFDLTDALCEPKPATTIPLLVGGKGDRMLSVAARWADEWNMWALPDLFAERGAVLDRACEAIGRDPSEIKRSVQALVFLTDDPATGRDLVEAVAPRAAVAGPPQVFAEAVADWAEVGVDEVIVPDFTLGSPEATIDAMDALAEVVAEFR